MVRIQLSNPSLMEAAGGGEPVEIVDAASGNSFVLLPMDIFRRLSGSVAETDDPRSAYPLVDQALAEDDAFDPLLESYQS